MMRAISLALLGPFVGAQVHADWLVNTYPTPAKDSTSVLETYGIRAFHNKSSKVSLQVGDGMVRLVADTIVSEGDQGYTAEIGLLHPLSLDGSEHDLTKTGYLQFEYRNDRTITDQLVVGLESPAYPEEFSYAGFAYQGVITSTSGLEGGTAWKKAKLLLADFAPPVWWTDIPSNFPTLEAVAKRVVDLRIRPWTTYAASGNQNGTACTKCVSPTMTRLTLELRNITLVDAPPGVPVLAKDSSGKIDTLLPGGACGNPMTILDTTFDDRVNEVRGDWGTFSDYDRTRTSTSASEGSSNVSLSFVRSVRGVSTGRVSVKAELDKRIGTQWHRLAGWAGVQTGVCGDGNEMSGFSFHIKADTLPSTVAGIRFRAYMLNNRDTASVFLPAKALRAAGGGDFCIQPKHLRGTNGVPLSGTVMRNIRLLMWEARIADESTLSIATAKVNFSIGNVRLHNFRQYWVVSNSSSSGCVSGAISPRLPSQPMVTYRHGFLELEDLQDATSLDILGLDGRIATSFSPASRIPLHLSRGTWILSAHRRDGTTAMQSFAVVDR